MCHRILSIDDEAPIRCFIAAVLRKHDVTSVGSGEEALALLDEGYTFDLILLDVMMPEMDGYDVIALLRNHSHAQDIPVIFVTGQTNHKEEEKGLRLGAVDYIAKPISAPILVARVENHLALKDARDRLAKQNHILEERVRERTRELALTQDLTIFSLASLAGTRDNETGYHIRRTQAYVRILAKKLAETGVYADQLDEETISLFEKSAPLHDIGKVGVPDAILLKPGKLTPEEFEIMKLHPAYGKDALEGAEKILGTTSFLRHAKDIIYCHHEKWDGSGYPQGLVGEDIPLSARLMAVADVYDALVSRRGYKESVPQDKVVDFIVRGKGQHFDPAIIDVFLTVLNEFQETATKFAYSAKPVRRLA